MRAPESRDGPTAASGETPLNLESLLDSPIDAAMKGVPDVGPIRLRDVGRRNWSLLDGDVPFPAAVLKQSALLGNSRWMRDLVARFGALICPHGKTTMAPQLFDRQLKDGAWGITVATVQQLAVCCRFGVPRVLLANQVVGAAELRTMAGLLRKHPNLDLYTLADSIEGVNRLGSALSGAGLSRPVKLLIEVGIPGGRTGCRTVEEVLSVAGAIEARRPVLALHGIEGFEGIIKEDAPDRTARRVSGFLATMAAATVRCTEEGLFAPGGPVIISAGGSAFYDLVLGTFAPIAADHGVQVVIRSGCYLTHDSKSYAEIFEAIRRRTPEVAELGPGLRPALQVWAHVQSTPERGLAIASAGKRDLSYDVDLPVPELWFRPGLHEAPQALPPSCQVTALNDQHAYVDLPDSVDLRIGDLVAFGISHPCTTFDKWQLLHVVSDDYRIVDAVRTFF